MRCQCYHQQILQASWEDEYMMLTSCSDLFNFLSNQFSSIRHEMQKGEQIPPLCTFSSTLR